MPWGQINASHTIGYTKNVTEASQQTARRSVKDSETASSKVSSKYRMLHKTSFRLVTEQGFEAVSKRTIRNPNSTPVTLHCFKVLQRIQLRQERYGARLCWAPSIKDPAQTFFDKIKKGRKAIIDQAKERLPLKPQEPPPPSSTGAGSTTKRETKTIVSPIMVADKWGLSGDMSADYDVDIVFDKDWSWDGDIAAIEQSISIMTKRPQDTVSRWVKGTPYAVTEDASSKLRVQIHIGAPSWLGGPGIKFQISANFVKDVTITGQQVAENTKYNDDLAAYRTALKEWTDNEATAMANAYAAGDEFEKALIAGLSPINEMISQVVEQHFPPSVRDECWEVDYWQRLFDWERASFATYPTWWSSVQARNPLLDPSDFINASWAKLYLPVRLGMERLALRWIFGKAVAIPLAKEVERRFDDVIEDLRKFRGNVLGAPEELYDP